jgi:hypothetical protein
MREVFALPHKLTKFVLDEELMLMCIRNHYISLVKLYHRNYQKLQKPVASLSLCKKHIQCLFEIARNRTDETRRKLF